MPDIESHSVLHVEISKLKPHKKNYVAHPKDQVEHIAASIEQHGFYRNVVIAKDNTILAGHGVVEAAQSLKMKSVPVVKMDIDPDSAQALKILTGDNEISNLCEVNDRGLADLLKEVKDNDPIGLLGTGFDDRILANLVMVTRPASEIEDFDAAAEWVGMPEYDGETDGTHKLTVNFTSQEERQKVIVEKCGIDKAKEYKSGTASIWYPPKKDAYNDMKSVQFKEE